MKMIICIFMALWLIALIFFRKRWSDETKRIAFISFGICVVIVMFVGSVTSRTYRTERFTISAPRSECTVREHGKETTIIYHDNQYIFSSDLIVKYDAPDKKSEQVEISGERRIYSNDTIEILYEMYHLRKPVRETTNVTTSVNMSVYNPS